MWITKKLKINEEYRNLPDNSNSFFDYGLIPEFIHIEKE